MCSRRHPSAATAPPQHGVQQQMQAASRWLPMEEAEHRLSVALLSLAAELTSRGTSFPSVVTEQWVDAVSWGPVGESFYWHYEAQLYSDTRFYANWEILPLEWHLATGLPHAMRRACMELSSVLLLYWSHCKRHLTLQKCVTVTFSIKMASFVEVFASMQSCCVVSVT